MGEIDKPAQGFLHRSGRKTVLVAIGLEGVYIIDSKEKVMRWVGGWVFFSHGMVARSFSIPESWAIRSGSESFSQIGLGLFPHPSFPKSPVPWGRGNA